jgi:hypothetical protein
MWLCLNNVYGMDQFQEASMNQKKIVSILVWWMVIMLLVGCQLVIPGVPPTPTLDRFALIPPAANKIEDPIPPIVHHPSWANPVPVPGLLNTIGLEDSPFITPDGRQMIFFFTPTIANPPKSQVLDGVTGLYISKKTGDVVILD